MQITQQTFLYSFIEICRFFVISLRFGQKITETICCVNVIESQSQYKNIQSIN